MLRRKPTAITLSQEDIAAYDDSHATRAARLNRQENLAPQSINGPGKDADSKVDPDDELKPLPGTRVGGGRNGVDREREREARILGR